MHSIRPSVCSPQHGATKRVDTQYLTCLFACSSGIHQLVAKPCGCKVFDLSVCRFKHGSYKRGQTVWIRCIWRRRGECWALNKRMWTAMCCSDEQHEAGSSPAFPASREGAATGISATSPCRPPHAGPLPWQRGRPRSPVRGKLAAVRRSRY